MNIPADHEVTSFKALKSTVERDYQSYRWFAYLIMQAALRENLSSEDDTKKIYRSLDKIIFKYTYTSYALSEELLTLQRLALSPAFGDNGHYADLSALHYAHTIQLHSVT